MKSTDPAKHRRRTVPVEGWWTDAVRRELAAKGMTQKQLAEKIGSREPDVSRCLSLKQPVLELTLEISDALDLPYPVIIPSDEPEARHLTEQRRLFKSDRRVQHLAAVEVAKLPPTQGDQSIKVPSRDVTGPKAKGRRHRV